MAAGFVRQALLFACVSRSTFFPNTKSCPLKTSRGPTVEAALPWALFVISPTTWTSQKLDRTSVTQWESAPTCAGITCFASHSTWRPSPTSTATFCVSYWPTCTTPLISSFPTRTFITTASRWVILWTPPLYRDIPNPLNSVQSSTPAPWVFSRNYTRRQKLKEESQKLHIFTDRMQDFPLRFSILVFRFWILLYASADQYQYVNTGKDIVFCAFTAHSVAMEWETTSERTASISECFLLYPRVLALRNPVRTEGLASLCTTKAASNANVEQASKARNVRQVGLEGHAHTSKKRPLTTWKPISRLQGWRSNKRIATAAHTTTWRGRLQSSIHSRAASLWRLFSRNLVEGKS